MYKVQHGIAPGIMNDLFRKRNMSYNIRNSSRLETDNTKTVHYRSEAIAYLGAQIWDLVLHKIKDSENI